jgi:hypothetical protein
MATQSGTVSFGHWAAGVPIRTLSIRRSEGLPLTVCAEAVKFGAVFMICGSSARISLAQEH